MTIIYNNIIPFKGFKCINLFGVLFARSKSNPLSETTINHESIHTAQQRELLYLFFYAIYLIEWLFRFLFTKDMFSHMAYRHISFEAEAFKHQTNLDYLKNRKHFSQWRN